MCFNSDIIISAENFLFSVIYHIGGSTLKTEVEKLVVEVTEDGKRARKSYPIVNNNGEVMAHRLSRLLAGKLGGSNMDTVVHFVGAVLSPPYTVLQMLIAERHSLQDSLLILEGHSELTDMDFPRVPTSAPNDEITRLVLQELRRRKMLKKRLKQTHKKPYCNLI